MKKLYPYFLLATLFLFGAGELFIPKILTEQRPGRSTPLLEEKILTRTNGIFRVRKKELVPGYAVRLALPVIIPFMFLPIRYCLMIRGPLIMKPPVDLQAVIDALSLPILIR